MNLDELRSYSLGLPGATEDIKWEKDLCFSVGGKMFLVASTEVVPTSASFKATNELFEELTEREGFKPAPYMARHKWVYVDDINLISKTEWKEFISLSYELVFAKLPVKIRKEISDEE